jgi:metallo-beta-lactamase class B
MQSTSLRILGSLAIVGAAAVAAATAQSRDRARDFDAEIRAEVAAAKQAAGFQWQGALVRTCLQPQQIGAENTSDTVPGYLTKPANAPARNAWYADPAKVFDDFYFVGGRLHSAWALATSEGLILFDTIYPYNSEELIVGGLKKLGLNPSTIKYVIITHGHGDHIGGAEMLQKEFGAKVVMGGPDWDAVERYPNRFKTMAPTRDIVATDGMKLTLGGKTVTVWLTPGHTQGTIAFTTTVRDRGRPVNIVSSAGVATSFINTIPDPGIRNFQIYIDSQKKIAARATDTNATVLISNHSEFDDAVDKNRMLAGRGDGPHPYEVGAVSVQNFFKVVQHCARAAQIGLEKQAATGGR